MRAFLTLVLLSLALNADELQVDPDGYYSIVIPTAMLPCELKPGSLACPAASPVLTIQTKMVAPNASVELMALNAEDPLRKKPNYRLVKKEVVLLDGNKTIVLSMTFNNLGNVTLPVVVRAVDAVLGDRALELEMACNKSTCASLLGPFDQALGSLHLAPNGQKLKREKASSEFMPLMRNFGLKDLLH